MREVESGVKKIIMGTPKGLAAGCSGLRAEHLKAVLQNRNMGRAAIALELLTKFSNLCIAGCLPSELQEFFCGGRLVPLNKKDNGTRPIVVREFLRGACFQISAQGDRPHASSTATGTDRRWRQGARHSGRHSVRPIVAEPIAR